MSEDVTKLKELLFETESRTLAELGQRMDDVYARAGTPERFTASVAGVLDEALLQAEINRHAELAQAIAPLIVKTIKTEIRNSQDELAEALYPSLGRMVKAYVVSAMRDLMDEINRRLESNRFMLRVRSLLSGRPVAELAFAEGQRLKAEEIYLIRQGSGELVGHWPPEAAVSAQDHRVSGILAAINEVATEAFDGDTAALRRIDLGSTLVYLRASPAYLLAAKCSGVAPPSVEQVIDEHFLATIERLRTLLNGGMNGPVAARAIKNLLAGFAVSLEGVLAEIQAKLVGRRKVVSPAGVVVWSIGLALAAWAGWAGYTAYTTAKVRAAAETALAKESDVVGYPVHPAVAPRGHQIALTGLVPNPEAGQRALARLRQALPAATIIDATTALPGGLKEARADIENLRSALDKLGADGARSDTALREGIAALTAELKRADIDGLRAGLQKLGANVAQASAQSQAGLDKLQSALAKAEAARQSDIAAVREELARAVALTPRQRLEQWVRSHAVFFAKDTDYRDPQAAAGALDELANLIKNTDAIVRVVGFTDEKGGLERNVPLSQARADKVVAELATRGIAPDRLVAVGRNDIENLSPVVGEGSPNRRVEFEIGFAGESAK